MKVCSIAATVAACATLGCTSPHAPTPLDGLIGFVDPYRCTTSEDFGVLLESLIRWERSGESYTPILQAPVVPPAFKPQIGEPGLMIDDREYRASLPLDGTWRGLPLRSLVVLGRIESESGFELVFDAPPATVLEAANRAGFRIPASGSEYRDDLNGVMGMNVAVTETEDGRGALSCFPG